MSELKKQTRTILLEAGLINQADIKDETLASPWFVKVLLAVSAWLAAAFILGFIAMAFEFIINSKVASSICGLAMITGAYAVLRLPKNEFLKHMALAISFSGQALVMWALFSLTNFNNELSWGLVVLLQVPLAIIMPSFTHRVFSSFLASYALSMALSYNGVPYIYSGLTMFVVAYLWLNEFKFPDQIKKIHAIGYGQVLALIHFKGSILFGANHPDWYSKNHENLWLQPWMGEILSGVVMLYVVWELLKRYSHTVSKQFITLTLLSALVVCAVSLQAKGITIGMLILLLGFAGSNRILMGLGIVSLLFFISWYYYSLDVSLLTKAQTLFVVGVVLLTVRWLLLYWLPNRKECNHV